MLRTGLLVILFVSIVMISGCVQEPVYSDIPRIEFQSMNQDEFEILDPDSLSVIIYFEDGDGDLGSEDSVNMFWEDSRVPGTLLPFKIPYFELQGNSKAISGTITTYYPITYCYDNNDAIDTFYYKIFVIDRAGNQSNVDSTNMIYLHCN